MSIAELPRTRTRRIGGVGAVKADHHRDSEANPLAGRASPAGPTYPDFVFNGGPVIANPIVYPTFWGSNWSDSTHQGVPPRMAQFLEDLIDSDWMNILTQYGAGFGAGGGQVMPSSFISSVSATLTDASIHTTIQTAIDNGTLPEPPANNTSEVLVIFLDESTAVNDPSFGIVMCETSGDNAFGYHNYFTTSQGNNCYYAVIPALDDTCVKNACPGGSCSLSLTETQEQRRTQVASHEFAEMLSDPQFPTGWYGPTADEIGDICNGETTTITVGANTWNVQKLYSKADDVRTSGATVCLSTSATPIAALASGPINWATALAPAVTMGLNTDGRLEAFCIGTDNALFDVWQTAPHSGPWSSWASLGGGLTSMAAIGLNSDGRLEAFARGQDGALWHTWQTAPHAGPWSGWESLGGVITSNPAVALNSDGRLEVFARGTDNALYHIWQTAPSSGPWSSWESLGGAITSDPAVARNTDGRLEVFARGTDNGLFHTWQTAVQSGPWSGWDSLGGAITSTPAVAVNTDGRLEVFARGTDDALYDIWQTAPHSGPWSGWASLGGVITSDPSVACNSDGRLEIFARGTDHALWHVWQTAPHAGPWSGWESLGGLITCTPAAVVNTDGRLEVFARGTDDALWHTWQTAPHAGPWIGWESIGGVIITTAF